MSLKHSYTLIAPFYDALIDRATRRARQESLAALPVKPGRVLLAGIGTGLDLPYLPPRHRYIGLDLNRAMLRRALPRVGRIDFLPIQGDAQCLPLTDNSFDAAVLHLILAVVPEPARCFSEIARVVKPGGVILIFDKFLRSGQAAPLRRMVNPLVRHIATRLDVEFEALLIDGTCLALEDDRPALAGGWFRTIRVRKD